MHKLVIVAAVLAPLLVAPIARADDSTTLTLPDAGLTLHVKTPYEWTVLNETRGSNLEDVVRRTDPPSPRVSITFAFKRAMGCAAAFTRAANAQPRPAFVPSAYGATVLGRVEEGQVAACLPLHSGSLTVWIEIDTAAEESEWASTTPILVEAARAAIDEDETPTRPPPQSPPPPPAPPRVEVRHWYGWQTLNVDAAGLALMFAATQSHARDARTTALPIGYATFLFGPPLVHVFHGQGTTALIDLGVRFVAPLVYGMATAFNDLPPARATYVDWIAAGYVGAVLLDAIFLANESTYVVQSDEPRRAAATTSRFLAMPQLQLRAGGATMGVGVAF